jgi:arylsulfatase A-like enzyme
MKRILSPLLLALGLMTLCAPLNGAERRFVLILWPGLRPETVTEENTPTLCQMIRQGTLFTNHHASYPTSINPNLASIATGASPAVNTLLADNEYRIDIEPLKPVATAAPYTLESGDIVTQHHYLATPTLAEILREQTPALQTDTAGTDANTLLLDRENRDGPGPSRVLAEGRTLPANAIAPINETLGLYPSITGNNKTARDTWTTAALCDTLWSGNIPTLTILNLAEPAHTAAIRGPGAYETQEATNLCDSKLAMVLATLAKRGILQDTNIFLLSTHGMNEAARQTDIIADLNTLGIKAQKTFLNPPKNGSIMVVPNEASALIYITGHDKAATEQTLAALRKLDYAGTIFTRDGNEGTFPLALAKLDTPEAPDILLSYRWTDAPAQGNLRGQTPTNGTNKGVSSSLSPRELKTIMVACGPDIAAAKTDATPTGNTDIAPTILWLLGMDPLPTMDGRILSEALANPKAPAQPAPSTTRHEARISTPDGEWTQYLTITTIGQTLYLEEGNATLTPAK